MQRKAPKPPTMRPAAHFDWCRFCCALQLLKDPQALRAMRAFLEAKGGQTREGELRVTDLAPYVDLSTDPDRAKL